MIAARFQFLKQKANTIMQIRLRTETPPMVHATHNPTSNMQPQLYWTQDQPPCAQHLHSQQAGHIGHLPPLLQSAYC